ncbi:MAG: 2-C-methyl-D-erythritol 2,4-cyclodiphosphate synthase [Acidimicrobiia bacterium]|nr:2-C-methyl-D-erythritol 2,4-cyclodiphosphate synthase [Acidimicrobiia bacterium]MCY4456599.1 2-C-methyl-D-erythritol 2,4-cyclodiphosphate synthase [Acidimicrobiaceae bacterium]
MSDAEIGYRVGHAFDVHARSEDPNRVLVLGGVTFLGEPGLKGHSDADLVAHVCADALLSAAGLGDIGAMFPDTSAEFAGADSVELLRQAAQAVRASGWRVGNVDCSVVLDRPLLTPAKPTMEAKLSAAVGAPVTLTGRRTEGLGALGRGEGIAAWAVALVAK